MQNTNLAQSGDHGTIFLLLVELTSGYEETLLIVEHITSTGGTQN
jgi:hypothetical protein